MATDDDIKAIEERLARRRDSIARGLAELKIEASSAVSRATRSWPLFAVAGGLVAGYAISRTGRHRASPTPRYASHAPRYAPVHAAGGESHMPRKSVIAAIIGIAATAIRIGTSAEARIFLNAVKRYRDRRHRR